MLTRNLRRLRVARRREHEVVGLGALLWMGGIGLMATLPPDQVVVPLLMLFLGPVVAYVGIVAYSNYEEELADREERTYEAAQKLLPRPIHL